MAGRPAPPGYNDAVRMPGRAYEGYIPPAVCPIRRLPATHSARIFDGDSTHVCCVRLPSSRGLAGQRSGAPGRAPQRVPNLLRAHAQGAERRPRAGTNSQKSLYNDFMP